jgi:acetyltransferase EpsM
MDIYMIGGGGFSFEVLEAFGEAYPDRRIAGVFDDDTRLQGKTSSGIPYLGTVSEFISNTPPNSAYIIAIGDNEIRETLDQRFSSEGKIAVTVVHPTASVSPSAVFLDGVYVAAFAFVGPKVRLGRHAIVNVGASLGHDCVLEDYVQVCPGARISGFAQIGRGAFLASNSVVPPSGKIGEYARLAANSFAPRVLPARRLAIGVPAVPVNL